MSSLNYVQRCTRLDKIRNYGISKQLGVSSVTDSIRGETRFASTCGKNGNMASAKHGVVEAHKKKRSS
jgi:hypothetical protein